MFLFYDNISFSLHFRRDWTILWVTRNAMKGDDLMAATLLVAAALAAQSSASIPGPNIPVIELKPVAYETLAAGNARSAVEELEPRAEADPADPATLINLGSAYAQLGQVNRAQAAFDAARTSEISYRLELADGRWMDSRRAASLALDSLDSGARQLAMR